MLYESWYRIKSFKDMDKDPLSWNQRIPITEFYCQKKKSYILLMVYKI